MAAPRNTRPDALATDRDVLRDPPRRRRNRSALENALRAERVARRRNFAGWLLTVLIAASAGAAIVLWIADRTSRPQMYRGAASPASAPAPQIGEESLPAGTEYVLPAR